MLSELIKSKIPAIQLRTTEEHRVDEVIASATHSIGKSVSIFMWNPVETTIYTTEKDELEKAGTAKELKDSLDYNKLLTLLSDKGAGNAHTNIFVFHGLKYYLSHTYYSNAHEAIYKLLSLVAEVRAVGDIVILAGGYNTLPEELSNLFYTYDMPLPTVTEISEVFKSVAMEYSASIDNKAVLPTIMKKIPEASVICAGLTLSEAETSFVRSLQLYSDVNFQILHKYKADKVSQSDILEVIDTSTLDMDSVIGFTSYKQWLSLRRKAFDPSNNLPVPKGVILTGCAGVGKSLIAKTTGAFLNLPVIRFNFSRVFRSLVGESEELLDRTLKIMDAIAPAVIWLEELNLSMAGGNSTNISDSGVSLKLMQQFLTWRQETDKVVFIVATANFLDTLPPMLYRKGRMDNVYFCGLPSKEERTELFMLYSRKHGHLLGRKRAEQIAEKAQNFSGVEIEHAVIDAKFLAANTNSNFSGEHIDLAITKIVPNASFMFAKIRQNQELFHEIGVLDASTGKPVTL